MTNDDIKGTFTSLEYDITVALNKAKKQIADAERDGYLGDLYRTDFTVTGRGAFPIDMLRYCQAWPKGEDDASQIERSIEVEEAGQHGIGVSREWTIRLTKYHRDKEPDLAENRWSSKFRWSVMTSTIDTVLR